MRPGRRAPKSTAPIEFKAAEDALREYDEAVNQRDYRLALSLALDALERAQDAAKQAAGQKAATRSDAERLLNDATPLLSQADERLRQAAAAKVPATRIAEPTRTIAAARRSVQEARTALGSERYLVARTLLDGLADRVRAAISALDAELTSSAGRRRR